jgi:oligoribonuclease
MRISFDIETTGLNPETDHILEVAAIVIDGDETPGAKFEAVVNFVAYPGDVNPVVEKMHTENGLWAACELSNRSIEQVDRDLHAFLSEQNAKQHGARKEADEKIVLTGRSVHFDLSFVKRHMPLTAALLSHRVDDVGCIERFLSRFGLGVSTTASNHRAMSDAEAAITQLVACNKAFYHYIENREVESYEAGRVAGYEEGFENGKLGDA